MRFGIMLAALALALWPAAAGAYENFIPLGQAYAPGDSQLPLLNSDEDRLNAAVDVYETEIYNRARTAKEFYDRLKAFDNSQELEGASGFIDY